MKPLLIMAVAVVLAFFHFGCGGPKVSHYEESRITSMAWAGDTLIAYSKITERGFLAEGIKRNPKISINLWIAEVNPGLGKIDTTYMLKEIPSPLGRIEFFPGGENLLYAAEDGVWRMNLSNGERTRFFTHPSFIDLPLEINVGPGEDYSAIVVNAEGMPASEGLLDLFMIETETGILVFHTDSLLDSRSFAWSSHDCISYIQPDPWNEGKNVIMQFGVTDCIIQPSDMTEEEVICNCPQPNLSSSGRWLAYENTGQLKIKENGE